MTPTWPLVCTHMYVNLILSKISYYNTSCTLLFVYISLATCVHKTQASLDHTSCGIQIRAMLTLINSISLNCVPCATAAPLAFYNLPTITRISRVAFTIVQLCHFLPFLSWSYWRMPLTEKLQVLPTPLPECTQQAAQDTAAEQQILPEPRPGCCWCPGAFCAHCRTLVCWRHTVFTQEWGRWGFLSVVTGVDAFLNGLMILHKISRTLLFLERIFPHYYIIRPGWSTYEKMAIMLQKVTALCFETFSLILFRIFCNLSFKFSLFLFIQIIPCCLFH